MGIYEDLRDFIERYKQERGKPFTHTSIGDPKVSLNIPENCLPNFFKLYKRALRKGHTLYFTEKPFERSILRVDLDFRFSIGEEEKPIYRVYNESHIERIVNSYVSILKNTYKINENFNIYILEKPEATESNGMIKDGIHILFPQISLTYKEQHYIRSKILKDSMTIFCGLPIINDYESLVDKAIIDQNCWQMYGSTKPNCKAYEVTKIYEFQVNTDQVIRNVYTEDEYDEMEITFPELFSMRKETSIILDMISDSQTDYDNYIKNIIPKTDKRTKAIVNNNLLSASRLLFKNISNDSDIQFSKAMLKECINPARADNYHDWITMGWVLRNIDYRLLDEWIEFSKNSTKYADGECEKRWEYMKEEKMGMATLRWWAKQDNEDKYNELKRECVNPVIDSAIRSDGTNFDVARIVHVYYNDEFKFVSNDLWYKFLKEKHRWVKMNEALDLSRLISTDIVNILNARACYWLNESTRENTNDNKDLADAYNDRYERCTKIIRNCKTTSFKSNIIKECKCLFHEPDFESMFDSKPYLLGFENGVYDLNMKIFRNGEPNDFISFCTHQTWTPILNQDTVKEIDDFLSKIFISVDIKKFVLETLACAIDGSIHQERFYILTGTGANGKSRLMDFIEKTLGDYYTIVPISLLTNKRVASNSAQSELVRTKGKRFAVMQEPSEGDKINIGLMKELTGNDTITARALYKENVDFKPQFKMFMTCNDLPDVPSNDGGTWRRIRVLQFKSKFCDVPNEQVSTEFKIDPELSEKIQRWGSTFIGMLINIHNSLDVQKIVEPDEVKVATTSYQRNNDMVGQFVDEVFVKSDNDKLSITKIWALYKAWAKENMNSRKTLEKPHLKQELEKLLGKQVKGSWKGYTIRKIKTSESSSDSE